MAAETPAGEGRAGVDLPARLMRFPAAVPRDPAVAAWFQARPDALGRLACHWFQVMRGCGPDVRELLHDGQPTACIGEAAFAYVAAFKAHVNLGFFLGTRLADPAGLLEGTGRNMRHVKLRPDGGIDDTLLRRLVETAYADLKARLAASQGWDANAGALAAGAQADDGTIADGGHPRSRSARGGGRSVE